jgi:hypothetical protein
MDWKHDSSGAEPALQSQSPEFNPSPTKKKKNGFILLKQR